MMIQWAVRREEHLLELQENLAPINLEQYIAILRKQLLP